MGAAVRLRSPADSTVVGVGATLVITAAVVVVLLLFGGGAKAVSDNAALIGALVALGGVFTTQLVNGALEAQRAEQARETQQEQRERDRELAEAQRYRELEVGNQRAQDDAAQAYLDQMARLLLDPTRPLRRSAEGDEVRTLARARTLTALSRLDGARKGNVVQFLYESNLINEERQVVDLTGVDLIGTHLSATDLSGADLREAGLREADLSGADLSSAYLTGAYLSGADLREAYLTGANLGGVDLREADLREADLSGATGVTNEDLEQQARSLEGATMPNGQKYEDWLKDREGRKDDG
jgi:uncharacterized protein YjbI with pentapeptide repeats